MHIPALSVSNPVLNQPFDAPQIKAYSLLRVDPERAAPRLAPRPKDQENEELVAKRGNQAANEDDRQRDLKFIEGNIWKAENRVSSGNRVKKGYLYHLEKGALSLHGKWAEVDGYENENPHILLGKFDWEPFVNEALCKTNPIECTTTDGFDQVQLYNAITGLADYLSKNLDIKTVDSVFKDSLNKRLVAHANAVSEMNAWYEPQSQDLTFGTSDGKWHLASDGDVVRHETAHFILDRRQPGLSGWFARNIPEGEEDSYPYPENDYLREGGAIHEGFADAVAALSYNDPEVGEDFPPAAGEGEDKNKGLRTVNNNLSFKDVSSEVHARGQVYAGFFWSLKKLFKSSYGKSSREAADTALLIALSHADYYSTRIPKPVDFVKAILKAVNALFETKNPYFADMSLEKVRADIIEEAKKRGMIKKDSEVEEKAPPPPRNFFAQGASAIIKSYKKNDLMDFTTSNIGAIKTVDGKRQAYQQMYVIKNVQGIKGGAGQKVKVIGAGLFLSHDLRGKPFEVSDADVKIFKKGEISEDINVSAEEAISKAKQLAAAKLAQAQKQQLDFLIGGAKKYLNISDPLKNVDALEQLMIPNKDVPYLFKIKYKDYYQIQTRIALRAVDKVENLKPKDAELVLIPKRGPNEKEYEKNLYYELKLGLSIYYVNASTGDMRVEKDIIVS